MNQPNPKDYNFLWLVNNQEFLITSIFAGIEYDQYDFIFTYENKKFRAYVSIASRKKLAEVGYKLIANEFDTYLKKIKNILHLSRKNNKFPNKKTLANLSDDELADNFLTFIEFTLQLWFIYFYTEIFCYDKVTKIINEPGKQSKLQKTLIKRVALVQKQKLSIRDQLNKAAFAGGKQIIFSYLDEIRKRTKITNLEHYHYLELVKILRGQKVNIKNRSTYTWSRYNEWKILTGGSAKNLIKSFNGHFLKDKEIKGQPAYGGTYTGKVKIIPFDIKGDITKIIAQMKKGEVLVTGSTGPEMILACKKAGAIVTEEGGITSHAAIISRELKTPCIIGTKIATQVLRDGDKVEVDATKGIVRKIT